MKGFVFFDLDGTLLNKDSRVDSKVAEAILALKKNGYEPFLSTGRSPADVREIMKSAHIHSGIFNNGQIVLFQDRMIIQHTIPLKTIERLKAAVTTLGDGLAVYNATDFKIIRNSPAISKAYAHVNSPIPEYDPTFYERHEGTMLLVIGESHDEDNHYHEHFPELSFFRNSPYSIDVVLHGHSKATGIRELLRYLEQEHLPTYAFGDHVNDKEMFKEVDVAIAMGNAIPEIKALASYVTTTNDNNGIINGLRHYHLIGDEVK